MIKSLLVGVLVLALGGCGADSYVLRVDNQGPKGDTGAVGATGPQGPAGQDATPVTVVKLCPGNTVYADTFVEIAFCIGGKLYATYSTHGGFSTEVPPGTYSSNGVGSSCSFTVGDNCSVTHL